ALLTWLAGSRSTGKLTGFRESSSLTAGPSLSTFTPIRVNPAGLYFLYIWSSSGISCWQGPHHVAQKLTMTTCPLYLLKVGCWPVRAVSVKLGAGPASSPEAAKAVEAITTAAIAQRFRMLRLDIGCPPVRNKRSGRECLPGCGHSWFVPSDPSQRRDRAR